MGVIMAVGTCTWACHGPGSMPTRATVTLVACPLDDYFLNNKGFSKRGLFSQTRLFGQANMPWPWQHAQGGKLGLCGLPMGDALAMTTSLSHGGLAYGCCLKYGCVALPWLLSHGGVMAMGACTWACHGLSNVPMSATLSLVVSPFDDYFPK